MLGPRPSSSPLRFLRLRADDTAAPQAVIRPAEETGGLADDPRLARVVEGDKRGSDLRWDDGVNDGVANGMLRTLAGVQLKDGAVDVSDRQLPFRQEVPELLDWRLLDVCDKPELSREPLEFADLRAVRLQMCLALQRALRDIRAVSGRTIRRHARAQVFFSFWR